MGEFWTYYDFKGDLLAELSLLFVGICGPNFCLSCWDVDAFFFILRSVGLLSDFSALDFARDNSLYFFVGSFGTLSPFF